MDKFGKEILKVTAKKNKIESKVSGIIEVLRDEKYSIDAFEVNHGKTDQGYEFFTWRFYFKEEDS